MGRRAKMVLHYWCVKDKEGLSIDLQAWWQLRGREREKRRGKESGNTEDDEQMEANTENVHSIE